MNMFMFTFETLIIANSREAQAVPAARFGGEERLEGLSPRSMRSSLSAVERSLLAPASARGGALVVERLCLGGSCGFIGLSLRGRHRTAATSSGGRGETLH
jgi:hypothetical protein